MSALPKKKKSRARRGNRRSHQHIKVPQLSSCPQCKSRKPTHHVCPECGTYNGHQILAVKTAKAPS
jgi:large subunit ribosomal protein L32